MTIKKYLAVHTGQWIYSRSTLLNLQGPGEGRGRVQWVEGSELNFHIWNANSQLFAPVKSETKMAAHGGKFWTSVSVLFAVLYVSSSPLHDFNFQFLFGSTSKTFTTMEKVHRRNITGPVLHIRVFKRIRYCRVA